MKLEETKQIFFEGLVTAMSKAGVKHAVIIYEANEQVCNTAVHKQGEESGHDAEFFDNLSDYFAYTFQQPNNHETTD